MTIDFDLVSKPRHYNVHPSGVECKDIACGLPWLEGSAFKYLWRYAEKGTPDLDLRKAIQFAEWARDGHINLAVPKVLTRIAALFRFRHRAQAKTCQQALWRVIGEETYFPRQSAFRAFIPLFDSPTVSDYIYLVKQLKLLHLNFVTGDNK